MAGHFFPGAYNADIHNLTFIRPESTDNNGSQNSRFPQNFFEDSRDIRIGNMDSYTEGPGGRRTQAPFPPDMGQFSREAGTGRYTNGTSARPSPHNNHRFPQSGASAPSFFARAHNFTIENATFTSAPRDYYSSASRRSSNASTTNRNGEGSYWMPHAPNQTQAHAQTETARQESSTETPTSPKQPRSGGLGASHATPHCGPTSTHTNTFVHSGGMTGVITEVIVHDSWNEGNAGWSRPGQAEAEDDDDSDSGDSDDSDADIPPSTRRRGRRTRRHASHTASAIPDLHDWTPNAARSRPGSRFEGASHFRFDEVRISMTGGGIRISTNAAPSGTGGSSGSASTTAPNSPDAGRRSHAETEDDSDSSDS